MIVLSLPPSSVRSASTYDEKSMTPLPSNFVPGPLDVICGRGKAIKNHPGNRRFRSHIDASVEKYANASSKLDKSLIVSKIVDSVREASPNGGFVKCEKGQWYEVGDQWAREKVGQSLRDRLHEKYRSSAKAKKGRSRQFHAEFGEQMDRLIQSSKRVSAKIQEISNQVKEEKSDAEILSLFNKFNVEMLNEMKTGDWMQELENMNDTCKSER